MGAVPIAATIGQSATGLAPYWKLSDLNNIFARLGERGWVAQMAGGVAGVRLELAAGAEGLGATGLTVFDDGVTRPSSPLPKAGRSCTWERSTGGRPDTTRGGIENRRPRPFARLHGRGFGGC